jgi:hypothetical protein
MVIGVLPPIAITNWQPVRSCNQWKVLFNTTVNVVCCGLLCEAGVQALKHICQGKNSSNGPKALTRVAGQPAHQRNNRPTSAPKMLQPTSHAVSSCVPSRFHATL